MNISVEVPERRGHKFPGLNWWPATTSSWVKVGFVVAFALAATAFAIFGIGERGTTIALRLTARWSFVLFWLAYTGGPMARLFGPRLAGVARRGRGFWPRFRFGTGRPRWRGCLDYLPYAGRHRRNAILLGRHRLHLPPGAVFLAATSRRIRAAVVAHLFGDHPQLHHAGFRRRFHSHPAAG